MFPVFYRALVNFTDSLVFGPELEDIYSVAFNEISEAVVDTVGLPPWLAYMFMHANANDLADVDRGEGGTGLLVPG